MAKNDQIPRFVLSLTDTKTTIKGGRGEQYYSINVGFKSKDQLLRAESQLDGSNELMNVIDTFFANVDKMGSRKQGAKRYTKVEKPKG